MLKDYVTACSHQTKPTVILDNGKLYPAAYIVRKKCHIDIRRPFKMLGMVQVNFASALLHPLSLLDHTKVCLQQHVLLHAHHLHAYRNIDMSSWRSAIGQSSRFYTNQSSPDDHSSSTSLTATKIVFYHLDGTSLYQYCLYRLGSHTGSASNSENSSAKWTSSKLKFWML